MGKWLRTRVLGSGSYGTVFLAISAAPGSWKKPIAMKSSRLELSRSSQMEEHILKSFTLCPEIVQSHGCQITNEQGLLVYNLLLEYAPHGTLSHLINKEPFLDTKATKVYIRALLRGLSCIHRRGFVHCDLKPQNILVFPPCPSHQDSEFYYQLKIADFGLSRTCDENFNEENWRYKFRGTPIYMSPESLSLGKIEAPLEIWSLGCIVLEMITGYNGSCWDFEKNTKDSLWTELGMQRLLEEMFYK
ncbi:mitogen-activated protein kinase kinase kinase 20-like [Gastrolobium bilobum]|uniref:mitogen-activated protein kinase kinase kinase 20-like n=1 Tax=Gastrolobium bilobum TaxID=150636 RepID=UPI002AB0F51F|nr:mitogen-activated protein kinase kinase kinase 20-like [Gastrolobium bilobum]